jgi:hypothetical protein
MAFTFRMRFSGLCVFVPERAFDTNAPGRVAVLLRNLTVPVELTAKSRGKGESPTPGRTDPHFPLLEFDPRNRRSSSTRDGNFTSHTSIFDTKSYCLLRGESLRILAGEAPPQAGVTTPPYKQADTTSLFWLAEMAQVLPEQATIAPLVLGQVPDGDPSRAKIIARLDLDRGRLSVSRLSDGVCEIVPPAVLPIAKPTFPRRVAIELLLEIPNIENEVVIEMQRHDEGEDLGVHQLILGPATNDPIDNVVEVHLQNREIDGFIGVPLEYLERAPEADFEVYYELSETPIDKGQPKLTIMPPDRGLAPLTGTDHTGKCPPTAMKAG